MFSLFHSIPVVINAPNIASPNFTTDSTAELIGSTELYGIHKSTLLAVLLVLKLMVTITD